MQLKINPSTELKVYGFTDIKVLHFDSRQNIANGNTNLDSAFTIRNIFISPKYAKTFWQF